MITDKRKIDTYKKDYVFDDNDQYDTMNAVSQRVYIALSRLRLNELRKKSINITLYETARIEEALKHLVRNNYISDINIRTQLFPAGSSIIIRYTNLTLGDEETIIL